MSLSCGLWHYVVVWQHFTAKNNNTESLPWLQETMVMRFGLVLEVNCISNHTVKTLGLL